MPTGRARSHLDALGVVACEALLLGFFLRSGPLLGAVDFSHLATWLRTSSPEGALTAMLRLLGTAVSAWLLGSTVLYAAAALTKKRGLLRGLHLFTLPVLRRVLDAAAAASVVAASFGSNSALAQATPHSRPAPIVRPLRPPKPVDHFRVQQTLLAPARVSATALGRHFPHPGVVAHKASNGTSPAAGPADVPSEANGFAGLAPGTKVVVVVPGDCLSVLAERHLGDWRLDSEIEALNWGRPQPDGRALVDDHWIYPGWVLVMPPNAVGALVVGHVGPAHGPTAYRGPTTPSQPRPASPQTVPTSSDAAVPAATSHGRATGGLEPQRPAEGTPHAPSPVLVASPPPKPPFGPGIVVLPASSETPGRPPAGSDLHADPVRSSGDPQLAALVGVGAVAAAGIVWRLGRWRREQLHNRPTGARVTANPSDVQAAERRARSIANTEAMRWVDTGLRYLTELLEDQARHGPTAVPSITITRVGRCGLEFSVSPPVNAPLGWFSPLSDGTGLVLDPELSLEDLEALAGDHWPAWPALVSIGESDGCDVLLNLEHAGSISVEGPAALVDATLGRIALELASQPWSDEMLAGLYLFGDCHLSPDRAQGQQVPSGDAVKLAEKLGRVSGAHQQLVGELSLAALRAIACEALPNVAVAFSGTPGQALHNLADAAVPESSGVALVGAGPYPGARWTMTLTPDGECRLGGQVRGRSVSLSLRTGTRTEEPSLLAKAFQEAVQALEAHDDSGAVVSGGTAGSESLASAPGQREMAGELEGDRYKQDPLEHRLQRHEPLQEVQHAWQQRDVVADVREGSATLARQLPERGEAEICILGPVDVHGGDSGALSPSRRTAALAVLAYVAAHERPVSADELASALWPLDINKDNLGGPQRKTVMNVVSRARALLGYGPGGSERLAHSAQGYRLTADVTCDWSRFGKLVSIARSQSSPGAALTLRAALELVRGEPFSGSLSSQFFEWVASEHLDLAMSAKVVDAAEELGQLYLDAGDLDAVTWAVGKGLQLDPAREELFRLWMHALGRAGRPGNVDEVYRRLRLVLQRRIHPLQEPQAESREVWKTYTAAEVAGT